MFGIKVDGSTLRGIWLTIESAKEEVKKYSDRKVAIYQNKDDGTNKIVYKNYSGK